MQQRHSRLDAWAAALFAVLLLISGAPALAEDEKEEEPLWYVEYQAGLSFLEDIDLDAPGKTEFEPGYSAGGAFGRRVLDRFRVELELVYNDASVDHMRLEGGTGGGRGGVSLFAAMANAYYDFGRDIPIKLGFIPWIGAGVGWGMVDMSARSDPGTNQIEVSDTDSVFVYNVMVGGTVPITDVVQITLRYRFISTSDIDVKGRVDTTPWRFDAKYEAHQTIAGMRVVF
jgi:opacity protein-like surface antigen